MDAREQHYAVRVDARPSGRLVERACARTWTQTFMSQPRSICEDCAERAAGPIGKINDCQLLTAANVRVNPNAATREPPIQYP